MSPCAGFVLCACQNIGVTIVTDKQCWLRPEPRTLMNMHNLNCAKTRRNISQHWTWDSKTIDRNDYRIKIFCYQVVERHLVAVSPDLPECTVPLCKCIVAVADSVCTVAIVVVVLPSDIPPVDSRLWVDLFLRGKSFYTQTFRDKIKTQMKFVSTDCRSGSVQHVNDEAQFNPNW